MARRFAPAALALLVLAVPAVASADVRSKRDRGGPRTGALDISRVTAVGNRHGLVVRVRLKGNFERRAGRARLRRAAIALILRPRRGRGRRAIVATSGSSRRPRTLVRTRSRRVGAARVGRTVYFAIAGGGLASVRRIQVKSFRRLRLPRRRARSSREIRITERQASFLLGERGADGATVPLPATVEDCEELRETARGAGEARRAIGDKIRRLGRAAPLDLSNARAAAMELEDDTLLELATRCGTGFVVRCTGYRHVRPGLTLVSADFALDPVFASSLIEDDFRLERLNPATGRYARVTGRPRGRDSFTKVAEGRYRDAYGINRLGTYRITGVLELGDEDAPTFRQVVVAEIVVSASPPETGGECPPAAN